MADLVSWEWACFRGSDPRLTDTAEQLRKILALERRRKFADTAVVGGLDGYLLHFTETTNVSPTHKFVKILKSLPFGGYRSLHPIQRKRVVDELAAAVENGVTAAPARPKPSAPAKKRKKPETSPAPKPAPAPSAPAPEIVGTLSSPVSVLPGVTRALGLKFVECEQFTRLALRVQQRNLNDVSVDH